ncbi:hypothetical protein [Pendulispora albinea]|uniref:Uncharacterized protein n=1 Tax=Pendulispora albinea TaxID=2741071 RepID=A0ABZ2LSB4_9BACT
MSIIGAFGYVLWAFVYFAWIYRAFRDRAPAAPMVAVCCNFSWEVLDVFAFPNPNPQFVFLGRAWLVIDVVILWQLLRYGPALQTVPLRRRFYRPMVGFLLILGLTGQYAFVSMYQDVVGIVISYVIVLIMSIAFILMFLSRIAQGHRRGISITAGWLKLVGSVFSAVHGHFLVHWCNPHLPNVSLMDFLFAAIFIFDCAYVAMLHAPQSWLRALVEPDRNLSVEVAS